MHLIKAFQYALVHVCSKRITQNWGNCDPLLELTNFIKRANNKTKSEIVEAHFYKDFRWKLRQQAFVFNN